MSWLNPSRFDIRLNESMVEHTSFRIGGPADIWVRVRNFDELSEILDRCEHEGMPHLIVGNGNNLLVRDGGIEGVVLHLEGEFFQQIQRVPQGLRVGAGVRLQRLVRECMVNGLTGCEFLVAVPGTVGGAVRMNAGTRDESFSERVVEVTLMDSDGQTRTLSRDEMDFGYRQSSVGDSIVLETLLRLELAPREKVRKQVMANFIRKKRTQDLLTPSAGSIFKNSSGGLVPSARLIEMSGLKGSKVGGARVSPMHSNFIVNEGGAHARDVESLITAIMEKVYKDHGVQLQLEVHIVGRKGSKL